MCHFTKPYVELYYKRSSHQKIKTRNKTLFKEGKKGETGRWEESNILEMQNHGQIVRRCC